LAGSWLSKTVASKADPILLEPMMKVEVETPEDYMGDIMGDIKLVVAVWCKVWMTTLLAVRAIKAEVPLQKCLVMRLAAFDVSRPCNILDGIQICYSTKLKAISKFQSAEKRRRVITNKLRKTKCSS
jgi:hypothetical protein